MQINPSDQAAILAKLALVQRELAAVTNSITSLEAAIRSNNQQVIASQLQVNPLNGLTEAVADSYTTIARITNIRANVAGLGAGGGLAGTTQLSARQ